MFFFKRNCLTAERSYTSVLTLVRTEWEQTVVLKTVVQPFIWFSSSAVYDNLANIKPTIYGNDWIKLEKKLDGHRQTQPKLLN